MIGILAFSADRENVLRRKRALMASAASLNSNFIRINVKNEWEQPSRFLMEAIRVETNCALMASAASLRDNFIQMALA
jgi:hypothetical protein